tara:strand:- start:2172 stop:2456 length:285 start_codon:yes stop_codon:yes gene_type:complete
MLKKEVSIIKDIIIIWVLSFIIEDKLFTGRNPPEEISENAKFKELNDLIEKIFKIMNIINVSEEYNKNILIACLKISELLNEIKLVRVFLKLSS